MNGLAKLSRLCAVLIVAGLAFAVSAPRSAFAAVDSAKLTVQSVAKELVCDCPDCGKQALDQCPNCNVGRKYRAVIQEQINHGKTKAQIIDYFASTYGEQLLGNPRPKGFGLAAFVLPALGVLVGLVPLGCVLRSRRKPESAGVASARRSHPEDPRIAAALKELDF